MKTARELCLIPALFFLPLALLGMSVTGAAQQDPSWLVVPNVNALDGSNVMPSSPALAKALTDAAEYVLRWGLPKDANGWRERRPQVEAALRRAIGLEMLPERTPLDARTLRSYEMGDYVLENVIFYSRPGFPVTANLYRPKASADGKRAAVLCPIGHYLTAGKAVEENQVLCIKLAKLGFVVLTYDAIGHGERMVSGNIHHEAGYALLPLGQTVAGWMVWDSMRALDYLLSLPEVDPERIGITGNSGGGLNTLFTSALDLRIRAAAVAGYVFQFNDWIKYGGPHCTCTYLPSLYRAMEWFEIAGLIAPRPVLMLQGERDDIFPISGARRAGRNTQALYAMLGHGGLARFDGIPTEPHAYSLPFRERMYGWMLCHLRGEGNGEPVAEGDVQPLAEDDPRLICDPERKIVSQAPSVVALARRLAAQAVAALPPEGSATVRESARQLVNRLAAPPDPEAHNLLPESLEITKLAGGLLEKVYFMSEVGQYIPGLLWLPATQATRHKAAIIVDDRGKRAVVESGLVEPLLGKGFAVLAVDLRGRGETLGKIGTGRDNNYHLVAHSIMWGRPLAGRRAFDLKRAVDFVASRPDLSLEDLALVGFGDDALPALLAAADDSRIKRVVCAGYLNSFVSQITAAKVSSSREELRRVWNSSAMDSGRLDNGAFKVDLGSVIPLVLLSADIPDIASLVAPRKLLYCQVRDDGLPDASVGQTRFQNVVAKVKAGDRDWAWYEPDRFLDTNLLLQWLEK